MNSLAKSAVQAGLITGLILVIYTLLRYLMGIEIFSNWWLNLFTFPIIWGFQIWAGFKQRSRNGGVLTYAHSYLTMIIVAVVTLVVGALFNILLFNVINTELAEDVKEVSMEKTLEMMQNWGTPESAIEQTMTKMDAEFTNSFSTIGILKGIVSQILFFAILTALFALIPKKNAESSTKRSDVLDAPERN